MTETSKAGAVSEAQAWRECAEWCAATSLSFLCNRFEAPDMHAGANNGDEWGSTLDVRNQGTCPQDERNDTRVIFCLLMALECTEPSHA